MEKCIASRQYLARCLAANRSAAASQDVSAGQPRTLYGSYEEKLVQMHAYHKLKGAIKAEARECHRRSLCQVARVFGSHKSSHPGLRHFLEMVAELPGSLPAAFAKGWLGHDCQVAYRSCDVAKAYTKRIIAAMLSIEPPPPDATT